MPSKRAAPTEKERNDLLSKTCKFSTPASIFQFVLNLLITGPSGAGKSSLLNNLHTLFVPRGVLSDIVEQGPGGRGGEGEASGHVTTHLRKVRFHLLPEEVELLRESRGVQVEGGRDGFQMPFHLWDTAGWATGQAVQGCEFELLLDGAMADGATMLSQNGPPTLLADRGDGDRVNCIIAVIPAPDIEADDIKQNMKALVNKARRLGLPLLVALTKVDQHEGSLINDPAQIFSNKEVFELIEKVAKLYQIRAANVFPLQLCGENPRLVPGDPDIEVPLLNLLHCALCASQDRIRYKQGSKGPSSPPAYKGASDTAAKASFD